ncbi:aminotransferase class V-fold PLP-dependent enzyme [Streptomyces iakyrus]|uniref:aminotransferase class V-fold PLP-dependent enzyme n=1 Tax=Streptomyces iakyrus TaxID=68219 RepID=UPI001FD7ED45|nr:aminotransferase class V-fold PLP-dependent enzyme [Streptomyces iakyrus]
MLSPTSLQALRAHLLKELEAAGDIAVNGAGAPCLPKTLNVSFAGVRGDTLVDMLAVQGVCVSAGSACHAGSDEPSHVLTAMGIPAERTRSSVRFSPGRTTSLDDVIVAAARTVDVVGKLRALGPVDTPQPTHA